MNAHEDAVGIETGAEATEPAVSAGVLSKSIQGGKWFLVSMIGQRFLNMVTFFVLARLLVPEDYGVITVILVVLAFFGQFSNPAFGTAILQRKGDVEKYLDAYWTFEVIRSFGIAFVIFCASGVIVKWFNVDASYAYLVRFCGLFVVITSLSNVRMVYFFKRLDFFLVMVRDLAAQIAYAVIAIGFALFVDRSPAALFAGYVGMYATGTVFSHVICRSIPRVSFAFHRFRDLAGFGKWVYGQNLLDYAIQYTDKIALGRLMDPSQLGIYAKSKDLAAMPTAMVNTIITKVAMPAFSQIQDQIEKVRAGFLKSLDVLLMVSLPAALLILLEGGSIVEILMGDRWFPIVEPLKIFAFGNIYYSVVPVLSAVFLAVGKPKVNFQTNLAQLIISVPAMLIGLRVYGMKGLAIAIVAVWSFLFLYVLFRARRIIRIGKQHLVPLFIPGAFASITVIVLDVALRNAVHARDLVALNVAWVALLGIVYAVILFAVSRRLGGGPWETLISILSELGLVRRKTETASVPA